MLVHVFRRLQGWCALRKISKTLILWKDRAIRELRGRGWLSHEKPWQANWSSLGHTHGWAQSLSQCTCDQTALGGVPLRSKARIPLSTVGLVGFAADKTSREITHFAWRQKSLVCPRAQIHYMAHSLHHRECWPNASTSLQPQAEPMLPGPCPCPRGTGILDTSTELHRRHS